MMRSRPDILVLGGGGVLGEAWITGVLAGIEDGADGIDLRRCEYFVGTSAGAIVAARLAAGQAPRRPSQAADALAEAEREAMPTDRRNPVDMARRAGDWALAWATPLASLSLAASAPGGALARAAALRALGRGSASLAGLRREIDRTGVSFDGRLRITTVNRASGRRVVFGRPSAPSGTVGQVVAASCAVPWLFEPVSIDGVDYVDGGVWSPTNLDAAPAGRGTQVLCLNPTASLAGRRRLMALARSTSRTLMGVEAGVLRRRGATVKLVAPDEASVQALGDDLMAAQPRARVLAAGYRQGQRLAAPARRRLAPGRRAPGRPSLVRER